MIQDAWDGLRRLRFSADDRIDFYKQIALLLKNGVKPLDALSTLWGVFSLNGEKPNVIKAVVADDCMAALAAGDSLADALEAWAPYEEVATIAAGERGNSEHGGFLRAALLVQRKKQIQATVVKALSYPAVLLIALAGSLQYIAAKVVPAMLNMTKKADWDTSTYIMAGMANVIANHWFELLVCAAVMGVFVLWSWNNLTGILRVYLDRLPPWSVGRMLRGATFVYNFGVLQASNVKPIQILEDDIKRANPYMLERLEAAKSGVRMGKNIGEALFDAGYEFPSRQAIEYLRIIVSLDGGAEQLMEFSDDWMKKTIEDVEKLGAFIGNLILLGVFSVMGLLITGLGAVGMQAIGAGP
ncbi:type II secretion system F family protein [Ralstonia sp. ASV6]|uniref:type II secretion system F family protein n=1 Tax=Ralstonia sp. ASV6 TaxID=2795124 RepID=UPI001E521A41|nr:type II secretion system F family protein [Ralstonia sp. ASV6]